MRNIDKLEIMTKHECYQESFEGCREFVYKIKFRCFKNVYMVHPRDVWKTDLMVLRYGIINSLVYTFFSPVPIAARSKA